MKNKTCIRSSAVTFVCHGVSVCRQVMIWMTVHMRVAHGGIMQALGCSSGAASQTCECRERLKVVRSRRPRKMPCFDPFSFFPPFLFFPLPFLHFPPGDGLPPTMPAYLCHGFRWYRRSIRIFVIVNSLDDCAPDWIVGRTTAATILSQLAESFPFVPRLESDDDDVSMPRPSRVAPSEDSVLMHAWSPVKLLEEYDESETERAARPYAYVADHVVRVDAGADVAAEMATYDATLGQGNAAWLERLRENVQPEEESRWYVVVCDDAEREVVVMPEEGEDHVEDDLTGTEDGLGDGLIS